MIPLLAKARRGPFGAMSSAPPYQIMFPVKHVSVDQCRQDLEDPKVGTWGGSPSMWGFGTYCGQPIEQHYDLTSLKLSNVRLNDQLLPTPQTSTMQDHAIKLPFPAEHPYSSHVERKAMFPTFDSPSDPLRGAAARQDVPKHSKMPANPNDVIVVSKTKGSGLRREIQSLPSDFNKRALEWNDHAFRQDVKGPDLSHVQYYPCPPKVFVPNLEQRNDAIYSNVDMTTSLVTANALRNVERDQWTSTYDRAHTGLGPANAFKLDNYEAANHPLTPDTELVASTVRTFDPPRPLEGRIARAFLPVPQPDSRFPSRPSPATCAGYIPRKTLSEVEEARLWTGTQYKSYPGPEKDVYPRYPIPEHRESWNTEPAAQPTSLLDQMEEEHRKGVMKHHDAVQQVEAANRWKELELQTPDHDITALNHKLAVARSSKAQPKVFYDHENTYRVERAGLYRTSYDPPKPQVAPTELFDTSRSHQNALDVDVHLNGDMHDAMRYGRTLGGNSSVPQYNTQPSPYELQEPFNVAKLLQKSKLQPTHADFRVQEGQVRLKETTYGDDYNTFKFLQEREIPKTARQEPTVVMSHQNQRLDNARNVSEPAHPSMPVSIPPPVYPSSLVTGEAIDLNRPRTAPKEGPTSAPQIFKRYSYQQQQQQHQQPHSARSYGAATARSSGPAASHCMEVPSTTNSFLVSSQEPQKMTRNGMVSRSLDLSYKDGERCSWKVGCGTLRPQTTLLKIQNSFTKTQAKKDFTARFPERSPDLRENLIMGKRHNFAGFNAQILRGTPVLA